MLKELADRKEEGAIGNVSLDTVINRLAFS